MIPSAGTPIKVGDVLNAGIRYCNFEEEIKKMLGVKYAFAVNSGTTAFYIILGALRNLSDKKEIILPAYTAPSLILPIKKAGLKYRLVDISLDTFNMDIEKVPEAVNDNTLAILCVHMFGLPLDIKNSISGQHPHPIPPPSRGRESEENPPSPCGRGRGGGLDTQLQNVFIIEDAASSFGTRKGHKFTGAFGDVGFISFNRGKNLSTVSGGIITTDNEAFAHAIEAEIKKLPYPDLYARLKVYLKGIALSFAVRPWFYTLFKGAVSRFKYTGLHDSFESSHYTGFQGSLGCSLLKRSKEIFLDREKKGRMLHNALKHINGIRIPVMPDGWDIVFNQFPFLIEDEKKRMKVVDAIIRTGVEATILYDKPVHKIYNDNSGREYPNAEYMAERLVLMPVHHYVPGKSLYRAVEIIEKAVKQ